MPYVQLSHKVFVICIKNRQNQIFSEMSLRDVMELPTCDYFPWQVYFCLAFQLSTRAEQ